MLEQLSLPDLPSAISLPGLGDGPSRSGSRAGGMMSRSGRAPAHASRLAALEKAWVRMTSGTCGRISETSLASAALQSCLESRLRVLMGAVAQLTPWPTAAARDGFPAHSPEYIVEKKAQGHGMANLNDVVQLTPPDLKRTGETPMPLAVWRAPQAGDEKCRVSNPDMAAARAATGKQMNLEAQVFGTIAGSSKPLTGRRGGFQLNPHFSRWLMGFPPGWLCSKVLATLSCRRSRRGLSGRLGRPQMVSDELK